MPIYQRLTDRQFPPSAVTLNDLIRNEKTHRFVSDAPFIFEGSSGRLCGEFLHDDINGCEVPDGWCRFIASEVEGGNVFDRKRKNLIVFCYF